jgi:hypothetical protein
MVINGRLLNWGVFFVTTGALVLAITGGLVTADGLAQLFRLWPVLVIALGVGVLLRATRLRAAGGIVLAVVPALVLGGLLGAASLAEWDGFRNVRLDCLDNPPNSTETRQGTFAGDTAVDLDLAGGELVVTTRPYSDWHLDVAARPGFSPDVEATASRLSVTSADRGWGRSDCRNDTWRLELPTAGRLDLAAEIAAGEGTLDLAGATLGDVDVVLRAGEARLDLGRATAEGISLRVEAGSAALTLPATGEITVDLNVSAGAAQVCAPEGMGLRVRTQSALASITTPGLVRVGDAWESPDYATAAHHADVTVAVNVGSVDVNPEGGCK